MTTQNVNIEEEYQEVEADFDAMERKASGRQFNNFTLKEGANVYRVLPPFGSATQAGPNKGFIYAEYYLHWGFKDAQGKDRPVQCLKKKKADSCPVCDFSDALEKRLNALVAPYTKMEGKTLKTDWDKVPEEVKAKHTKLNDTFNKVRWQRHYYFNALSQDGKVGVLKTSKTAGDDLIAVISASVKNGFNPVSLKKGCFMNLVKRKTGPRPTDVEVKSEPLSITEADADGNPVKKIKLSEISSELMRSAVDLFKLYPRKTADELSRALKGDTSVFDRKKEEDVVPAAATEPAPVTTLEPVTVPVTVVAPTVLAPATVVASAPAPVAPAPIDDVEAIVNASTAKAEQSMDSLLKELDLD